MPVDLSLESMDSYQIVNTIVTSKRLVSWIQSFKKVRFILWSTNPEFQKLQFNSGPQILKIFKRFDLFSLILRIITNLHKSLVLHMKQIFTNKPQIGIPESELMDSFPLVIGKSNGFSNYRYRGFNSESCFQKFNLWIQFLRPKISKDTICLDP